MSTNSEVYRTMVDEIDERGTGLTDWETRFIGDLLDKDWQMFTDRQKAIIDRIFGERVND